MAISASSDVVVLVVGVVLASLYLFRDQLFNSSVKPKTTASHQVKEANGHGNPRDFVAKMKAGVRHFLLPLCYILKLLCRKSALSSFTAHKLGQPRSTLFVSLRKPSPSSVSLPSSATLKNMTLKTWTNFPRIVLQFS